MDIICYTLYTLERIDHKARHRCISPTLSELIETAVSAAMASSESMSDFCFTDSSQSSEQNFLNVGRPTDNGN